MALLMRSGALQDNSTIDPHGHIYTKAGVEIIQLGDLGDYTTLSQVGDLLSWEIAHKFGFKVLWGNHDWALKDRDKHGFKGQTNPLPRTRDYILGMKPVFALAREGVLLTHAGLHPHYASVGEHTEKTAEMLAGLINNVWQTGRLNVIDDIGPSRGGRAEQGGILWRDAREALLDVPQVFGHSSGGLIRRYNGHSLCIDVGSKRNGNLAGVWLDTMQVVAVGPDAEQHENYPPHDGEPV